jgi:hypothetical protein
MWLEYVTSFIQTKMINTCSDVKEVERRSNKFQNLLTYMILRLECEQAVVISAIIYTDRLITSGKRGIAIDTENFLVIFYVILVCSIKYNDDNCIDSNRYYCKHMEIDISEYNDMEIEFLKCIKYELYVSTIEYEHYVTCINNA